MFSSLLLSLAVRSGRGIGPGAGDVGGANLAAQVVHGVPVALQDQVTFQLVRRRGRQRQQQEGVEIGERLPFDAKPGVDRGDVGGVGDRAFDFKLRRSGHEPALDRERDAGFLEAQHLAGQRGSREARIVVLALERVLGAVPDIARRRVGIPDLGLALWVEGADLDVDVEGLCVIDVAQATSVDRQRADPKLARRCVRRIAELPVLSPVLQVLEEQVRPRERHARHQHLVRQVAQRHGELQHLDARHGFLVGPVGVAEEHVAHANDRREPERHVEVRDAKDALRLPGDVALERRAEPVPVEQDDKGDEQEHRRDPERMSSRESQQT